MSFLKIIPFNLDIFKFFDLMIYLTANKVNA